MKLESPSILTKKFFFARPLGGWAPLSPLSTPVHTALAYIECELVVAVDEIVDNDAVRLRRFSPTEKY